jgi:hypothetical protein
MKDKSTQSAVTDRQELNEEKSHGVSSESKSENKDVLSNHYNIQTYVYVGYAYLLLMGIANDAIYYGFLGINIISYSNILDVLLSPLVRMIDNPKLLVTILGLPVIAYFYLKLIRFFARKKKKKTKLHSHKLVTDSMKNQVFVMTAIMVFSGYIGFGIGNGNKTKARLEKKSLKTDYELTFRGGETKNVHLIGSNSGFVFYVEEDATVVSISPFQENISVLKKLIPDEKETE